MRILIVGEAPGNPETNAGPREGWPLWRVLDGWMFKAGWEKGEALRMPFINVYPTWPGLTPEGLPNRLRRSDIDDHAHLIDEKIQVVRPDVVVTLGAIAMQQFIPRVKHFFEKDGGSQYRASRAGHDFIVVPMPHPSGLNRIWNTPEGLESRDKSLATLARLRRHFDQPAEAETAPLEVSRAGLDS